MRKIVAGLFISLAGVVEAPDRWHFPYFNQEMAAAVDATLGAARKIVVSTSGSSSAGATKERSVLLLAYLWWRCRP